MPTQENVEEQIDQAIAEEDTSYYQTPTNNTNLNNNYYNSLSSAYSYYVPPTGKNKKIKKDFYNKYFKFDKKIKEEKLNAKRDEFWNTAPCYEGKLGNLFLI